MNCSQILYLCRPETTLHSFENVVCCCELLSNFVSLSSWNNIIKVDSGGGGVVNCSQILYLCRPETTTSSVFGEKLSLWIALKFCIFVVLKQRKFRVAFGNYGCELLSNFVSLSSWNNYRLFWSVAKRVVNCSQILYLCRPETTKIKFMQIARCCELLSNFVSLSSWNNLIAAFSCSRIVVNCSQILYLCRPETTKLAVLSRMHGLWIALKFCIFVVLKQLQFGDKQF